MLDKDKPVQGFAVYAEFRNGSGSTLQMFFTPDGYTSTGNFVTMKIHRRVVSAATPKKQWKISTSPEAGVRAHIEGAGTSDLAFDQTLADSRLAHCFSLLDSIHRGPWTMVRHPLVVEVSKKDMDDLISYKTPTKIIYRINQTREAAGFPESLF